MYLITYKASVYAPAEKADTVFLLYPYLYSVSEPYLMLVLVVLVVTVTWPALRGWTVTVTVLLLAARERVASGMRAMTPSLS
jgi:hypothetical protein